MKTTRFSRTVVAALLWPRLFPQMARIDRGEEPARGAVRELEEEVGLAVGALEPLATYYTTPGFCDEVMHLYRATALRTVPAKDTGLHSAPGPAVAMATAKPPVSSARDHPSSASIGAMNTVIA